MDKRQYPTFRSHFIPRSTSGRRASILFLLLFALAEPPFVFTFANRIEPTLFGAPFLYWYLLIIYLALIGILGWIYKRGI